MKKFKLLFAGLLVSPVLFSQNVGINETGDPAHPSAMLDVSSTNKGVLMPRLTESLRDNITSPEEGLMIYQTDNNPGYYFYNGSSWEKTDGGASWKLEGNSGTNATSDFIGTTDNTDFLIKTNNEEALEVKASNQQVNVPYRLKIGSSSDAGTTLGGSLLVGDGAPDIFTGGVSIYSNMSESEHPFQGGIRMHNATTGTGTSQGALLALKGNDLSLRSLGANMLFETSSSVKMKLANNGRLGIGDFSSSDPEQLLHLKSSNASSIDWNLVVQNENNNPGTGYGTGIKLKNSNFGGVEATKWLGIATVAGTGFSNRSDLVIYANDNGPAGPFEEPKEILRVRGNGYLIASNGGVNNARIGVNVANPDYAIDLPNLGGVSGRARANQWTTYSDKRVKSQIAMIQYGLETVMELTPKYYFHHNSTQDVNGNLVILDEGEFNIGFLAQDLFRILPELVLKPENDEHSLWSVDYAKLSVVLTKAIQEQQAQIEVLENNNRQNEEKITALESEMKRYDQLEKEVEQLKALLLKDATNAELISE